jgi:hypothetical protein
MVRRVDAYQFDKFLDTLTLGNSATILIASHSGELLARLPRIDEIIGEKVRWGRIFGQAIASSGPTTARVISPIDGVDRLASMRPDAQLPDYYHRDSRD